MFDIIQILLGIHWGPWIIFPLDRGECYNELWRKLSNQPKEQELDKLCVFIVSQLYEAKEERNQS